MRKRAWFVAAWAVLAMVIVVAAPVFSTGGLSGDQQYGDCGCHSTQSTVTVTMQSSPSTSLPIMIGQTVTVWVNVTGAIGGQSLGALIASSQGSSGSLPTENGWSILSDPSGTSSRFNYYKVSTYSGSFSFVWTLTAPSTSGAYPLYARVLHTGQQEYTRSAGPITFDVQQEVVLPPQVQITSPSNGATISGTISVNVTATPGSGQTIAYVRLRVDAQEVGNDTAAPYTFQVQTTGLTNGAHVLNATAADMAGRRGYSQISITVNNAPPANPTVLITSPTNGQEVIGTLTVSAIVTAGQGQAIAYAAFSIDGTQFANDSAEPYSADLDTTPYADGVHSINVTAADTAGRRGYQQIIVVFNNTGGGIRIPIVSISTPANGAVVTGLITVAANVTSTVPISSVTMTFGGVSQGALTSPPFQWSVDTNDFPNGQRGVNVTATDANGSSGYMQIVVSVNNPSPVVSITSPLGDSIVSGNMTVVATVESLSPLAYVSLSIDGTEHDNSTSLPSEWVVDTNPFAEGRHTVNVTAADDRGREGYAEVSVIVRNAPTVTITSPSPGANYEGRITVSATVAGLAPIEFVQLWLNGSLAQNSTTGPYSWEVNTANYGDGVMTINVTAWDSFGRAGSQEMTILIDNLGQDEPVEQFIATVIAGSIGLVALITALIVAVLFIRGRRYGGP